MNRLVGIVVLPLISLLAGTFPTEAQSPGALTDQLQHSSAAVRRAAAYQLGRGCVRPSPQTVQALVKALDDPDWQVRAAAAEALGTFGQTAVNAVPDLLSHAEDNNADARDAIALSLGRLNVRSDEVFQTLGKLSGDEDPEVKRDASIASALLGRMDVSTVPNIIDALRQGKPRSVDAAQTLCVRMGVESPKEIVPALVAALQEYQEPLGSRILWVMTILGTQAETGLPGISQAYHKLGPKERLSALAVVVKADPDGQYVSHVLGAALKQPNAKERRESLLLAMRYRPGWDKLLSPTMEAMKDPDPVNRYLAVRSARQFGQNADALLPAVITLTRDPNVGVRKIAIEMLGHMGKSHEDVLRALEGAASGDDVLLKVTAIKALGNVGHSNPEVTIKILERIEKADGNERTKKMTDALVNRLRKLSRPQPSPEEVSDNGGKKN